ncbi:hypothetical protein AG1IA_05115 [Rhizoctonia solani AG-1 IA]|uniref:Uncharacterized protein n=1 Tax=Thanatephorus cucumeris (strain AG1-IA) TaxID=983506 RepID=L8WVN2_THACA|nr:hypothetical protein AG1IA_05115 [Rhizoctonia solani AG-1 IA]
MGRCSGHMHAHTSPRERELSMRGGYSRCVCMQSEFDEHKLDRVCEGSMEGAAHWVKVGSWLQR